jgi:hypothetical protein
MRTIARHYTQPRGRAALTLRMLAILQQAIFAVFGLTESRWVLFGRDESVPQLEVPGLAAPVLYNRPLRADPLKGAPGGVFVTWKIVRKTADEATVQISDWEGPLAAGGQDVFLRRINNEWASSRGKPRGLVDGTHPVPEIPSPETFASADRRAPTPS